MHVTATGNGHTRLFWQKARWNSDLHQSTMKLAWGDCETFAVEEREAVTEEQIAEAIVSAARANASASWNLIKADVTGKASALIAVRDRLIADGELVNTGTGKSFKLWATDDPALVPAEQELFP